MKQAFSLSVGTLVGQAFATWRRTLGLVLAIAAVAGLAAPDPAEGTNPTRRQAQVAGRVNVEGAALATAPYLAATLELGGAAGTVTLGDVNGDGRQDVVAVQGGGIIAVDAEGRTIFDEFAGATDIVAVRDLDGDRQAEVVFIGREARRLAVLDVRKRAIRWEFSFPSVVDLLPEYIRVVDLNSSLPGVEIVVFADHSNTLADAYGYFFTAGGQIYAQPTIKTINGNQLNFPQFAIGDIDGIGDPEVVVAGRPKLLVYGSDGVERSSLEFRAGDPEGRHYGTVSLANVDDDPDLEAIVIADRISPIPAGKPQAITVLDLVPTVRELWRYVPSFDNLLQSTPHGVVDFDGDGRDDFIVNRFDGSTQAIEVYDGGGDPNRAGAQKLLYRVAGAFVWDIHDTDGDGVPELFATKTKQEHPSLGYNAELAVLRIARDGGAGRLEQIGATIQNARYVMRPVGPLDAVDLTSSIASDRPELVWTTVHGAFSYITYTRTAKKQFRVQFRRVGSDAPPPLDMERPGAIKLAASPDVFLVGEGASDADEPASGLAFYRLNAPAKTFDRLAGFHASAFAEASPVVADLNGDGAADLLVRHPGRVVAAYAYNPAKRRFSKLWEQTGNARPIVEPAPNAADTRVLVTAPNNRGRATLAAYDGNGRVVWRTPFPDIPGGTDLEVVAGEFTGAPPRDVWVSAARNQSWMLDGATGAIVWNSRAFANFDNHSAIADYNKDGADDLVVVSNNLYGIYDGRTGKPLLGPMLVTDFDAGFFSTPIPTDDGSMLLAARSVLAKAKLTGKRVWTFDRKTERTSDDLLPGVALGAKGIAWRVGGNFGPFDRFAAFEYSSGKLAFTTSHIPITDVLTADLDADGVDEFLFGTLDGRVVALEAATGHEVWSISPGAYARTPILANLGGGAWDLIVPLRNGTVCVYSWS